MISKILVPHDGTEMSEKALQKAVELAKVIKAELVLLYIIDQIPVPASIMLGGDSVLINRTRRIIRRELEEGWNKLGESKIRQMQKDRITATCQCLVGSAAEQILRFAKSNNIDMIVMASARLKGLSKIKALGSVTRKVSEMADCPVLIVH